MSKKLPPMTIEDAVRIIRRVADISPFRREKTNVRKKR